MEVKNPQCSVNQIGEMPPSDAILDVLMESFCKLANETEHSVKQHFKQIFISDLGHALE